MIECDKLLVNATRLNLDGSQTPHSAIAIAKGKIAWSGLERHLPVAFRDMVTAVDDCQGKLITPGLIDCHTHLVYAGTRAQEFKQRLNGASYEEIARRGGGILSTVKQTRQVLEDELLEQSLPRLQAMQAQGVLTVEIKSGYGLDLQTELKMLRVAKKLGEITGVRVKTTFLGAHAVPPEYKGKSQAYINYVTKEVLPAAADEGLVDAVDIFCESIGFSLFEAEQLFQAAKQLRLPVKCHAEQLSNLGASALAAEFGALSSDHLEYLDEKGIAAMAKAGTVAVLLPGAFYFLRETKKPPVDLMRKAGIGMAIATDCNPGSSPTTSLLLMMNMACQFFSLTVAEVLSAVTYQAARALGIEKKVGSLEKGMHADLIRWSVLDASELCYQFGGIFPHDTMVGGAWLGDEK